MRNNNSNQKPEKNQIHFPRIPKAEDMAATAASDPLTRRSFFGRLSASTAVAVAAGVGLPSLLESDEAKAADAPQHHIRRVIVRLVDIQIRHQRAQVIELGDVRVLDGRGRNGSDRCRNVAEIFGTFSRGDDDFTETVVLRGAGRSGRVGSEGHGSIESASQSQRQGSQTCP